jgi:hypothetical protein
MLQRAAPEHLDIFSYFVCSVSYGGESNLNVKTLAFCKNTTEIINEAFKLKVVSRQTRVRIYKALNRPTLYYGRES